MDQAEIGRGRYIKFVEAQNQVFESWLLVVEDSEGLGKAPG